MAESLSSIQTTERVSQYDFCVSRKDSSLGTQGSTLSAIPSSKIMDSLPISDKTEDLIGSGFNSPRSPRPKTAPLPVRSKIIRITSPTKTQNKFEVEQNAFETWLVEKLKSEDIKRKRETMTAAQKKLFEKKKAEEAEKAHIQWMKHKEAEEKKKNILRKKQEAKKTKKEEERENEEKIKKQKAKEKYAEWLEAKKIAEREKRAREQKIAIQKLKQEEQKRQINDRKFKEWLRKINETNPDIGTNIKPRDARWIDPTPCNHPEFKKIRARPKTAAPSVKRELFTLRDSTCYVNWR